MQLIMPSRFHPRTPQKNLLIEKAHIRFQFVIYLKLLYLFFLLREREFCMHVYIHHIVGLTCEQAHLCREFQK